MFNTEWRQPMADVYLHQLPSPTDSKVFQYFNCSVTFDLNFKYSTGGNRSRSNSSVPIKESLKGSSVWKRNLFQTIFKGWKLLPSNFKFNWKVAEKSVDKSIRNQSKVEQIDIEIEGKISVKSKQKWPRSLNKLQSNKSKNEPEVLIPIETETSKMQTKIPLESKQKSNFYPN